MQIRDSGKYKIDLIPSEIYDVKYPSIKFPDEYLRMFVASKPISKINYREYILNLSKTIYDNMDMGYNKNKTKRLKAELLKKTDNDMDHSYSGYLNFYNIFNNEIKNTYSSIKIKVLKKDSW